MIRAMKRDACVAFVGLAVLSLCIGIAIAPVFRPDESLVMRRPGWMRPERDSRLPESSTAETIRTAVSLMVPPETLGDVLVDTKQAIRFQAETFADTGIATEIAREVVRVFDTFAANVEITRAAGQDVMIEQDYVLAVWPDLPDLIRRRVVVPTVLRIPSESRAPRDFVTVYWTGGRKLLELVVNTRDWQVTFPFSSGEHCPAQDLFLEIERKNS